MSVITYPRESLPFADIKQHRRIFKMDVQNFTFIQMGGPGGKKQSQYHSLVRSHAMQSVWERKKRRMPLKQTEHNTKSLPLRKNFVAERHTNTSDSVAHAHRRPKVPERRISSKTKLCRCSPPESISSEDSDVCHADTCSARITSLRGDTQESASAVGTLTPPHTPPSLGSPDSLNVSNVEPFGTIALNIDATTSRFIAHCECTLIKALLHVRSLTLSRFQILLLAIVYAQEELVLVLHHRSSLIAWRALHRWCTLSIVRWQEDSRRRLQASRRNNEIGSG